MQVIPSAEEWVKTRQRDSETAISEAIGETSGLIRVERALLSYQQKALWHMETGCNVLVIEKSRRIGMTWGLAAEAVLRAARARANHGSDWLYISYSQDMTREFIDACAMWARLFHLAAGEAQEFLFKDEKEGEETKSIQAFRIAFASGFEIVGLSSAPRSLRGKQGVVMIDEAAFVDSFPELMKAALALLMWGGQVVICSTHNGTDNPFNQLIQDIHAGRLKYAHMRVDFDEALRDGLYRRICLIQKKPWSNEAEKTWRDQIVRDYGDAADEELFCVPAQGSGTWLSNELIERQMTLPATRILRWIWPKDYLSWSDARQQVHLKERLAELDVLIAGLEPRYRHALGFDFGRVADLSVAAVLAIDDMLKREAALVIEMRNAPYEEQLKIIRHLWSAITRRGGAAFDATGAGGYVAEGMARRYGAYDPTKEQGGEIAQIRLTTDWYRLNMPKLKAAFEDGAIAIIRDAEQQGDLRTVKVVKGVAVIPDVRTGAVGLKRHGDFAVALALAWYGTLMNVAEYGYDTAAAHEDDDDRFNRPQRDLDRPREGDWPTPLGAEVRGMT